MSGLSGAESELNSMLDEGVHIAVVDDGEGAYTLRVSVDDEGCAECLVPDVTLSAIASDALQRHGSTVSRVDILHLAIDTEASGDVAR